MKEFSILRRDYDQAKYEIGFPAIRRLATALSIWLSLKYYNQEIEDDIKISVAKNDSTRHLLSYYEKYFRKTMEYSKMDWKFNLIYEICDSAEIDRYNYYVLSGTDVNFESSQDFVKKVKGYSRIRKALLAPQIILQKIKQINRRKGINGL